MEVVSNDFRPTIYSGEADHTAVLTIGNTTIDNENIKRIKVSNPIIDKTNDTFYIGTFVSKQVEIEFFNADEIDLTGQLHLSIGTKVNGDYEMLNIGYFNIESSPEDYYKNAKIVALDNAVKFKPNVDYSSALDPTTGLISCEDLLIWLCNHFGVTLGTYPNTNKDIEISTYDNSLSGKQYISYIAEIMGGNAQIGRDGHLYIIPLKQTPSVQIDATKSKSWQLKDKYEISGVTYFDVLRDIPFNSGDDTKNILYIRSDNPFVVGDNTAASAIIENIYNEVVGTVIYNLKCENYADYSLDSWDFIEYTLDNDSYITINNNEYTYEMTIMGKVDVEIPNKQIEQTTNTIWANNTTKMNVLKTTIDQVNNELEILAEQIEPISQSVSGTRSITLENAYEGTLHYLAIYGEMSCLFPATDIYPSNTLYPKDTYLLVDNEKYHLDFTYLRYMSSSICDKWICEDGKQRVERYVGVDNQGHYYALTNPIIEEKEDLIINVSSSSTISMESFSNAKIFCEYLLQNDYTDTFAPTADIVSKINLSPGSAKIEATKMATITAQNIKLEGYTTINSNFGVDLEGNMWAKNGSFSGNILLEDGGKVIGGDGLLTQFHYTGSGKCGFTTGASVAWRNAVYVSVYIPENFKIESANLVITHNPGYTYQYNDNTNGYDYYSCYVRYAKMYYAKEKQPSADGGFGNETAPLSEGTIVSTIGSSSSGKTFSSSETETVKVSLDKNIFEVGNQFLYIADFVDAVPTDYLVAFQKSGFMTLDLFLTGYITTD